MVRFNSVRLCGLFVVPVSLRYCACAVSCVPWHWCRSGRAKSRNTRPVSGLSSTTDRVALLVRPVLMFLLQWLHVLMIVL